MCYSHRSGQSARSDPGSSSSSFSTGELSAHLAGAAPPSSASTSFRSKAAGVAATAVSSFGNGGNASRSLQQDAEDAEAPASAAYGFDAGGLVLRRPEGRLSPDGALAIGSEPPNAFQLKEARIVEGGPAPYSALRDDGAREPESMRQHAMQTSLQEIIQSSPTHPQPDPGGSDLHLRFPAEIRDHQHDDPLQGLMKQIAFMKKQRARGGGIGGGR